MPLVTENKHNQYIRHQGLNRGTAVKLTSRYWVIVAGLLVVGLVALGFVLLPRMFSAETETSSGNIDFPVVIRTKGGLLEIATVKYRKAMKRTTIPTLAGHRLPFCNETAHVEVKVAITYRIPLAQEWNARVHDGRLYVSVPQPQPSLPVAVDTNSLNESLDKCWMMVGLDTQKLLLRSISGQLEKEALSRSARQLAIDQGGRATVEEFLRTWMFKQQDYKLAPDAKIELRFEGS